MEPKKDTPSDTANVVQLTAVVREPPHNFEAEQALLGAILVNNAAYQRVAEFLRAEHFADPLHGKLFDSLSRLIERGQVVERHHAQDLLRAGRGHEDGRRRRLSCAPRRGVGARHRCRHFRPHGARPLPAPATDRSRRGRGQRRLRRRRRRDRAAIRSRSAEKKLYDLASSGQTEGGFKPFRAALTEATVAAEAAYQRPGQLTGVATGLAQLDQPPGRPAPVRPHHPRRPPIDGQDCARHQHRLQRRQSLSRGA